MFSLNLSLTNPFSERWNIIFSRVKRLGNKAIEINFYRTNSIVRFLFEITTHCDHAGSKLELGLLSFELDIQFYDTRHWDYEHKNWHINS